MPSCLSVFILFIRTALLCDRNEKRFIYIDVTHNDLINLRRKVQFVEQSRASSASNNGHNARGSYLHYLK